MLIIGPALIQNNPDESLIVRHKDYFMSYLVHIKVLKLV